MIHLYTGTGKGKTTAAIGLAVRMLGADKKVLLISFLKNGKSGEALWLRENSDIHQLYQKDLNKFVRDMNEAELAETKTRQSQLLEKARELSLTYDAIILDELTDLIALELIDLDTVVNTLKAMPKDTEVIITGHQSYEALIELADYYTEFVEHKHPYQKGEKARKGVEY